MKLAYTYTVGVLITWVGLVLAISINGSTNLQARLFYASVIGSIALLLISVPIVIAMKCIIYAINRIRPVNNAWQAFWGITPLIVGIVLLITWRLLTTSPKARFKQYVLRDIPSSVCNIDQGGFVTLNSYLWIIGFQCNSNDLIKVISQTQLTQQECSANDVSEWLERIQKYSNMRVNASANWKFYIYKDKGIEKYAIVDSDIVQVYYIESSH